MRKREMKLRSKVRDEAYPGWGIGKIVTIDTDYDQLTKQYVKVKFGHDISVVYRQKDFKYLKEVS